MTTTSSTVAFLGSSLTRTLYHFGKAATAFVGIDLTTVTITEPIWLEFPTRLARFSPTLMAGLFRDVFWVEPKELLLVKPVEVFRVLLVPHLSNQQASFFAPKSIDLLKELFCN
jgi:hypothetical protein